MPSFTSRVFCPCPHGREHSLHGLETHWHGLSLQAEINPGLPCVLHSPELTTLLHTHSPQATLMDDKRIEPFGGVLNTLHNSHPFPSAAKSAALSPLKCDLQKTYNIQPKKQRYLEGPSECKARRSVKDWRKDSNTHPIECRTRLIVAALCVLWFCRDTILFHHWYALWRDAHD